MYIAAQISGGLSIAILLVYTLVRVSRKTILICNILINLLWALHYLLLGAYTGAICSFICAFMVAVFFLKGRVKWLSGIYVPLFFAAVFIVFGIVTWNDIFSVIPIVGHMIIIVALWMDREIVIKTLYIFVAALWVVYNVAYFSYIGVIGQSLSFLFNIFYVAKYYCRQRKREKGGKTAEKKESE